VRTQFATACAATSEARVVDVPAAMSVSMVLDRHWFWAVRAVVDLRGTSEARVDWISEVPAEGVDLGGVGALAAAQRVLVRTVGAPAASWADYAGTYWLLSAVLAEASCPGDRQD
jgi:hypothetical protein